MKEKYFIELIENHGEIINKICRSFTLNNDNFKDLRQDILINIWKGLENFRNDANIKTWIYRISFNTCVTFQKKSRKNESIDNLSFDSKYESEDYENIQWMKIALSCINPLDRSIMVMWLEDLSYDEIAGVVGLNRNTVATRIRRSKEKIKKIITSKNF